MKTYRLFDRLSGCPDQAVFFFLLKDEDLFEGVAQTDFHALRHVAPLALLSHDL